MIRFNLPTSRQPPKYFSWRQQWRLLVLVAAFGLVILAMNRLRQPDAATALDTLLVGPPAKANQEEPGIPPTRSSGVWDALGGIDWSVVRDNSFFRPEESDAWFSVIAELRDTKPEDLNSKSLGDVTYAQLTDQSDIYRGMIVTVRGTVRRTETLEAPANEIGLDRYFRLVVQPEGGKTWPIIAYCLQLPAGFPVGENTPTQVVITGVFFKTWSYTWDGGLGTAPVILAREPRLLNGPAAPSTKRPVHGNPVRVVLIAGVAAVAIVAFIGWSSRRYGRKRRFIADQPAEPADVATAMQRNIEG